MGGEWGGSILLLIRFWDLEHTVDVKKRFFYVFLFFLNKKRGF